MDLLGDTEMSAGQLMLDDVRLCLVPWADLLRHSSEAESAASEIRFDRASQCAVVRAHRDYKAGEEVFRSAGRFRSASELLMDIGFVDAANQNHWIEVPLKELAWTNKKGNQRLIDACLSQVGRV